MNTTANIDIISVFVFLGVFQGILISFFLIFRKTAGGSANRYQGFFLLSLSLCIFEQFLNHTGYITRILWITNTTEPLNLVLGPVLYLYVKKSIDPSGSKREWIHFVLPAIYLSYMMLEYFQSNEFKYNSYINSTHPDWQTLAVTITIPVDPFNIKRYLNFVTAGQVLLYLGLAFLILVRKSKQSGVSITKTDDNTIISLRNLLIHMFIIILIFIIVKLNFEADLGDYFIGIYVAVFTLLTTFRVMNSSAYFEGTVSFMDITVSKYQKSSLNEAGKQKILSMVLAEFDKKEYFSGNLASLSDLAKRIGVSQHHVSQVINEKLNRNFFELLASYRVEKAKKILSDEKNKNITIEEISEMVGYNSKTAFNNAFRKITGMTPSDFRSIKA